MRHKQKLTNCMKIVAMSTIIKRTDGLKRNLHCEEKNYVKRFFKPFSTDSLEILHLKEIRNLEIAFPGNF